MVLQAVGAYDVMRKTPSVLEPVLTTKQQSTFATT